MSYAISTDRDDPSRTLYVRMPASMIRHLDWMVEDERRRQPGVMVTRSDVVRMILAREICARRNQAKPRAR